MNHKCLKRSIIFALLIASLFQVANSAVWSIVYPRSELEDDVRYEFPVALLDLALQKTSVRYELTPSDSPMLQAQAVKRLEENLIINVMWSMTDIHREQQLRPIRIPIAKGLLGARVLVTHKNSPFLNAPISSLKDLLQYSPVQGISWPDTKILQANGFNVITAKDYTEAFTFTNKRQADFFPRSVVEVYGELKKEAANNLRIKNDVMIAYPTAQYFFTNKRNLTLSRLIETGLLKAIEDGSYDALFQEHYGDILKKVKIENRLKFDLVNPLLPPLSPINNEKLWYFPPMPNSNKAS